MDANIRAELERHGAFSRSTVVPCDEQNNLGELVIWTAERVAQTGYFKQVAVVDNDYVGAKYPHAIVVPQDTSAEQYSNVRDAVTYPVHVVMRVLDSNPFRGVNSIAALCVAIMKILRRTPNVENLVLPAKDCVLSNTLVLSSPILPSMRVNNEYQGTVRVQYTVLEPRVDEIHV